MLAASPLPQLGGPFEHQPRARLWWRKGPCATCGEFPIACDECPAALRDGPKVVLDSFALGAPLELAAPETFPVIDRQAAGMANPVWLLTSAAGRYVWIVLTAHRWESIGVLRLPKQIDLRCVRSVVWAAKKGVVSSWNQQHPAEAVRKGDVVYEANGAQDRDAMLQQLERMQPLSLSLLREVAPVRSSQVPTTANSSAMELCDVGFEAELALERRGSTGCEAELAAERLALEEVLDELSKTAAALVNERDEYRSRMLRPFAAC